MSTIDRNNLKERLIDCGYIPEFGLENTINNLLNLKTKAPNAYIMLEEWMKKGKLLKFEPIEGIDLNFLRNTLNMKDPAVILAYGMLLYDPQNSVLFLKRQEKRKLGFVPPKKKE